MSVDLTAGTATGDGTDTLTNIENVTGSTQGDTLTGDTGDNTLDGAAGNDILYGDKHADYLAGGPSVTLSDATTPDPTFTPRISTTPIPSVPDSAPGGTRRKG